MRGEYDGIAGFDDLVEFWKRLPNADKNFTVMAGISHASFQQKNYRMVYHILHAFFAHPRPAYRLKSRTAPTRQDSRQESHESPHPHGRRVHRPTFVLGAHAQGYPTRPVKIVVPFGPGGSPTSSRASCRRSSAPPSASRSSSRTSGRRLHDRDRRGREGEARRLHARVGPPPRDHPGHLQEDAL